MIRSEPYPIPKDVADIITSWEKRSNSRVFSLITTGMPSREIEMGVPVLRGVIDELKGFEKTDKLDVLLNSSGGYSDVAYQIAVLLRSKCDVLRVFIYDWAKSAATLFALNADEIHMSDIAQLGPVDAQIFNPRHPEERSISALDDFQAMEYLKEYAYIMLDTYVSLLLSRNPRMKLTDVLKHATPFVTGLMSSLYGQVDPYDFGSPHRSLQLAEEYGMRLMKRYGYSEQDMEEIRRIVKHLVWHYPSHSFNIDIQEAKDFGLKVQPLSERRTSDLASILDTMSILVGFIDPEDIKENSNAKNKKD